MWLPPTNAVRLADGDVHVWRWTLQRPAEDVATLKSLLSTDEVARAERFYFARHQDAFVVARAGLRTMLARYLEVPPQDVVFRYGDAGKPELSETLATGELAFNLSHSGDWAICAVALRGPLGVDIERVRAMHDAAGLARRYFAAAEVEMWERLATDEQTAAFFRCWTRKEAYLKALGDGLRAPLDRFVVSFAPGEPPRLVEASPQDAQRDWTIEDLDVCEGYTAAAIMPRGSRLTQFFSAD